MILMLDNHASPLEFGLSWPRVDGSLIPFTPAWSHFNQRRAELIRRKVRGVLAAKEEEELAWLQRETLAAVERAFPRPLADRRLVEELKKGGLDGVAPEKP